ncbi:MAG: hypothetical protein HW405_744 [Candidatus Berkelbacteria bacterium]|nr:hypothetical protein [Candidatus Berkelbacteria bacterium]
MKKNLVLVYLLWVILYFGLLLIFNLISGSATVGILALAFGLVFFMFPGWLLNRFLKIEFKEIVGQSLVNFVLSLGFYLLINLTAIVIGLSIFQLLITNIILLIILFGAAFIYDYSTQKEYHLDFKFEKISVIYLLPIMVSILIIVFIDSQGANFNGDPYYHLAIVRKAFDGLSLTVSNLSYSHSAPNNPAYILPAWHLVIATYAKLTKIDIFAAWSKVNLTLLVWALMIIVCFLVSLFFLFYAGPGYFFQRLAVPDTLAQFILLPSVLAFSLIYIFTKNKKILWLLGALMIALADVHAIHYLYYIFILLFFAISLSLANLFKGKDTLKPAWMLLGVNILVLILVGVILELKSGFTSSNLTSFLSAPISEIAYPTFKFFQITFKIGLALLPLTLIFAKNRQSLIIAASFLLAPIIYWTPLKDLFLPIGFWVMSVGII